MMQGELPVMQKQERISPLSRGSSHIFLCSSLPNMCSTSIFPVSVDRPDICPEHQAKYDIITDSSIPVLKNKHHAGSIWAVY